MNIWAVKTAKVFSAGLLILLSAPLKAATVSALDITGGMLEILNTTGSSALLTYGLSPGSAGKLIAGTYQGAGEIVNTISIVDLLGNPLQKLSADTASSGGIYAGPYPVPSGYTSGNVLVMDLSSWFAQSTTLGLGGSLTSINQEPNQSGGFAFGTLSGAAFAMTWNANPHITVGSISGPTRWTLYGTVETVNTVPLPATSWLLVSGLFAMAVRGGKFLREHSRT